MLTALLIIWVTVLVVWYWLQRRHLVKLASQIPGPSGYPIIGNGLTFWGKPEEVFKRLHKISTIYTRMVALWIGPQLHVALFDPKDVELVLRSRTIEKADEYKYLKPWLGESLLLSTGAKFKQNKKLIMPSFHVNNLKRFLDVFNDHVILLVDRLKEEAGKDEFDVHHYLSTCTMDVLLETVMGISKETLGKQALIYARAVEKLGRLAHMRVYKFWLRPDIIFRFSNLKKEQDKYLDIVHSLTEKVIQQRKKEYESRQQQQSETGEPEESKWTIFLDNLLGAKDENGVGLADEDIKAEVMTMMFAGQDTTSATVGFVLSLLGIHQRVQDKVIAELDEVFGESNRPVSFEDIQSLRYMEQVIQETWRLYPPIPLIGKKAVADIQLENCVLPEGCTVAIIIMAVHRNPTQFPNPDVFNPDNFLPERIKVRHPYSFLPFSAGSRTCIDIFKKIYNHSFEFDRIIRLWAGPKLLVLLVDPRDVEIILSSHVYIDKSSEYRFFQPWLGNGLLISTGQIWRSHRKLIAPTFHLNVLKGFIDLFNANSKATVEKMRKEEGKTFDCHDYMSEATVEMLLETAMGVSKKTQDKSGFEYAMAVMKMCDILHLRHTKIWLRPDWVFSLTKYGKIQENLLDVIHSLTRKVVKSKMEAFNKGIRGSTAELPKDAPVGHVLKEEEAKSKIVVEGVSFGQSTALKDDLDVEDNDVGEKKRLAFLDLMIEASQNGIVITDEEIKEQVDTIMFEGHDTTAAGSSFFLSMMGIHPEIQEKVIQEMDEIFGDSDRPATFADTLEMKYLERCLLETLRLYPPVPVVARQLQQNVKLSNGDYTLPAGCTVIIGTYKVHRRADIYPNPDKFDPDNFLPERTANRHYYAFIPFSAGPRSCVGRKYAMLKLKILLSTIMRNFRIKSDLREEDFQLQGDIILKRAEGFKVQLESRKKIAKAC